MIRYQPPHQPRPVVALQLLTAQRPKTTALRVVQHRVEVQAVKRESELRWRLLGVPELHFGVEK